MMKLDISPMLVTEISLTQNSEKKPENSHPNTFSLTGEVHFSSEKSNLAKLISEAVLVSYGKYKVQLVAEFVIHFQNAATEEEAGQIIEDAHTEASVFPYISSYLSTFLALSGYQRPNIPVVFFSE